MGRALSEYAAVLRWGEATDEPPFRFEVPSSGSRVRSPHRRPRPYPTQKPLALLERIIQASSNPGDVVLDPLCGCGTTIDAAEKLGRQWIGIDITQLAITLIKKRLQGTYGSRIQFVSRSRRKEAQTSTSEKVRVSFPRLLLEKTFPSSTSSASLDDTFKKAPESKKQQHEQKELI